MYKTNETTIPAPILTPKPAASTKGSGAGARDLYYAPVVSDFNYGAQLDPNYKSPTQLAKEASDKQRWEHKNALAAEAREQEKANLQTIKNVNDFKTTAMPKVTQELIDAQSRETLERLELFSEPIVTLQSVGDFEFPKKSTAIDIFEINDPATILVLDAKNNIRFQTNKFLLTSLTKAHQERFQVMETFGAPHVSFFDARTKMYSMQGVLLDAYHKTPANKVVSTSGEINKAKSALNAKKAGRHQWAQAFQEFYTQHLRGTELKKKNYIAAIYVNRSIIKGYPVQLNLGKESAASQNTVTFTMTWVIEEDRLSDIDNLRYMYDGGVTIAVDVSRAWSLYNEAVNIYQRDKKYFLSIVNDLTAAKNALEAVKKSEKEMKDAEQVLSSLVTAKNKIKGDYYEVDQNY